MTNIAGKVSASQQGSQLNQLAAKTQEPNLAQKSSAKLEASKEMGEKRNQLADRTTGSDKENISFLLVNTPAEKLMDTGERLHAFEGMKNAFDSIFGGGKQQAANRMEEAFLRLKAQFVVKENKIDRDPKTGSLQPHSGAKTVITMLWNDLASNQDKLTAAGLIFHCHKVSQGAKPDFLMHTHKLVTLGMEHPQFYKQIHYIYKRFVERGKATHEIKFPPDITVKFQKVYPPYARNAEIEQTADMLDTLTVAVQQVFQSLDKALEPFESKMDRNPVMTEMTTDFNEGNIFGFQFTASMKNKYYAKIDQRQLAKMLVEKGLRKGKIPTYETYDIK